ATLGCRRSSLHIFYQASSLDFLAGKDCHGVSRRAVANVAAKSFSQRNDARCPENMGGQAAGKEFSRATDDYAATRRVHCRRSLGNWHAQSFELEVAHKGRSLESVLQRECRRLSANHSC